MKIKKILIIAVGIILTIGITGCEENKETVSTQVSKDEDYYTQLEIARTTPFGKYPEQVNYTLGKLIGSNNSNLPNDETYEDNAYTRFLLDLINVQNEDVFEEMDTQYNTSVSMAISSGDIPDIMVVESLDDLQLLVENDMIADLTQAYEDCMSDTIKDMYTSYGSNITDVVTFDDKIMAIPETNIDDGPNMVWLRKDWMDDLGLEDPETLADVEYIVSQFIEKDPGNNGDGNTIGLVCDPNLSGECGYSSEYLLDIVFSTYGAFPKQWIYNEDGNVVYGSVQYEAKEALAHIHEMYVSGILDNNFLLRTNSNIIELISNGECGSFFGPWWAPNNPLMQALEVNPEAEWMPYLIATDEDGSTSYYSQNPTYKYVVVSKDFEYPEVACKIVSALFDYGRYEEDDNQEFIAYFQDNIDPTARPLAINVDYSNALSLCYSQITEAIDGTIQPEDLNILEYSYYEACDLYLKNKENATPEQWAAYTSRFTACQLLADGNLNKIESLYFDETDTMTSDWWKLEDMEKQTYLQIVTGDLELDAFDTFVENWMLSGGDVITQEVQDAIDK